MSIADWVPLGFFFTLSAYRTDTSLYGRGTASTLPSKHLYSKRSGIRSFRLKSEKSLERAWLNMVMVTSSVIWDAPQK